jgi:predicted phosphoadenosine phosphosulfate sulfurtransferase
VQSESPVELSLGVDLTAGENWEVAAVTWHPWDETGEDIWVRTQVTVRATGPALTIFLKGYHQFAAQGGATLFDDVQVIDLGP